MDGVIYRGGQLIPGADRFIERTSRGQRPVPLPDQQQPADPARRRHAACSGLGIDVDEHHFSPAPWRRRGFWPSRSRTGTAFVIGEGGLLTALHENGYAIVDKDPDYVVVGEGRTVSFEMVEAALGMILGGCQAGRHQPRPQLPHASGACGPAAGRPSPCSRPPAASRRSAWASPARSCSGLPARSWRLTTDQTVVIGDTMETDILGGVQLSFKTILVLSGGTRREDLARYAYRPDQIVDSIADLDPVELQHEFGTGSSRLEFVDHGLPPQPPVRP